MFVPLDTIVFYTVQLNTVSLFHKTKRFIIVICCEMLVVVKSRLWYFSATTQINDAFYEPEIIIHVILL